jgi:hypothetical protein
VLPPDDIATAINMALGLDDALRERGHARLQHDYSFFCGCCCCVFRIVTQV